MQIFAHFEPLARRLRAGSPGRAVIAKAVSFAMVGLVNLVVDFGIFSFAYFHLALPILVANVMSWCVAVSGSYVMNSMTTFASESGRRLRIKDYGNFVVSQIGGLITSSTVLLVASYFVPVILAKLLAIGVGFLVNFSLSHFFVFRRHAKNTEIDDPVSSK
ncbi:MAG TPA: GtrA family protein [Xanthobacteraceae bacterium]|jgi:putative flippase GtrA|nr:GtrA family protein [Xanthobacteraceae bacterium]